MKMKNTSSMKLVIGQLDGLTVEPGATVEIEDGYCVRQKSAIGTPGEAIIQMLAPQLEPADPVLAKAWKDGTLELDVKPPAPTALDFEAGGASPGVAALLAEGEAAAAPKPPRKPVKGA